MALLVTPANVRTARPELSTGVSDNKINTYIENAEIKYIRPYLGERFFVDLKAKIAASSTLYDDLMNGSTYTYAGYTYTHPGIKDVLARFAFALYSRTSYITDTPFGQLAKQNQDAREIATQSVKACLRKTNKWRTNSGYPCEPS